MKSYHDIAGDGGSRVLEQVQDLHQRIAARLAGVKHRLAIGSGKGGVGKSTLTFQIALALRARGRAVGILDADLNGPSQARLAGLTGVAPLPGATGTAVPRTAGGIPVFSVGGVLGEPQTLEFANVADGESHTWRATRERTLLTEVLASVEWGALDVLLFDLPPGAERTVQYAELLGPDAAFVLVTVPSDLSRGVVARSATALRGRPNPVLGYVENMAGYWCADCGRVKPLFPESADAVPIGVPCLGRVPFDPALAADSDRGTATPNAPVADVAARIAELLEVR